jgi:hypothetical protein
MRTVAACCLGTGEKPVFEDDQVVQVLSVEARGVRRCG